VPQLDAPRPRQRQQPGDNVVQVILDVCLGRLLRRRFPFLVVINLDLLT
jgi:hypothetical protein